MTSSFPERPSIMIQGIGAIGGVVAARLIEAGADPVLVAGSPDKAAAITRNGITLRTPDTELHQPARAYASVADVPPGRAFDVVLIVTKATSTDEVARAVLPRTHETTIFVALQNGIVEPLLADRVGKARVVPSLVNWAALLHAPGVVEQTVVHGTVLGEFDGSSTPRLLGLAALLEPAAPVFLSDNILGAQWAKLQMNCSVTVLAALAGAPLAELLAHAAAREVFIAVCREVLAVAAAAGVRLETLAVDPYVAESGNAAEREAWLAAVLGIYGKSTPSILVDLRRGRRTEIDFITGYLAETAAALQVPAPLCQAATSMVHEAETGTRALTMDNIGELAALMTK